MALQSTNSDPLQWLLVGCVEKDSELESGRGRKEHRGRLAKSALGMDKDHRPGPLLFVQLALEAGPLPALSSFLSSLATSLSAANPGHLHQPEPPSSLPATLESPGSTGLAFSLS